MNFKLILAIVILSVACLPLEGLAQSGTLTDVTRFDANYFRAIKDAKGEMAGYFVFYKTDKAPKGMALFQLNIYDNEFNEVMNKKMTEPKYTRLLSANSNGSSILFRFYDPKSFKMKYIGYNFEGEKVISKSRTVTDKYEKKLWYQPNPYLELIGVLPVPGYGYAEYAYKKMDKINYAINYYPENKNTRAWSKSGKSGLVESAQKICAVDNLIISLIYSREKLMSVKDMEMHVVAHDVTTGKKKFDINLNKIKFNTVILDGEPSPDGKNIILYGLDYAQDAKTTSRSRGLLKLTMNKEGEILKSAALDWKKDFKFSDSNDKQYGNIHIHEFYPGTNGHTFIVGEQFSINGGLSALSMLSGSQNTSFKIDDLVIIEVDHDFKVVEVKTYPKNRNSFTISGIPLAGVTAIGMMADAYGYFDFSYLQAGKKPGDFTVGYIDFERKSGAKNGFVFNGITHRDGKFRQDKVSLLKKRANVYVREAKPGYISILEYSKKTKDLEFRLEKVNF